MKEFKFKWQVVLKSGHVLDGTCTIDMATALRIKNLCEVAFIDQRTGHIELSGVLMNINEIAAISLYKCSWWR